jgi:hypothetical protein
MMLLLLMVLLMMLMMLMLIHAGRVRFFDPLSAYDLGQ